MPRRGNLKYVFCVGEFYTDCKKTDFQLHIVHMKDHYTDLKTALADPDGVAVLGFFYEVKMLFKSKCIRGADVKSKCCDVFLFTEVQQCQPKV